MKQKKTGKPEKGAIEIIEEATMLLRCLPAEIHVLYYIGSLPFILAFLYFWADMSRGAWAHQYLGRAAFLLTAAYVWMKCWQAAYCARIRAHLLGEANPQWTWRKVLRLVTVQTALQPISFIVLPLSSIIILPFGWAYAFFHNVSVCGSGQTSDIREVYRDAGRQAGLFAAQNHIFIIIYCLCGIFVFLNLGMMIYLLPKLLSMFLGIETMFSRTSWGMFNTTLLMSTLGLSYLGMNPLAKAVYALRCFYGESLRSGADLKVELKKMTVPANITAAFILLGLLSLSFTGQTVAAENNPAAGDRSFETVIPAADLNRSIDEVISKREYSWRMPREKTIQKEKGVVEHFFSGLVDTVSGWLKPVKKWIKSAVDWLVKKMAGWIKAPSAGGTPSTGTWIQSMRVALLVLIAAAVAILIFVLWRVIKTYRREQAVTAAQPATSAPDILRDETLADELPADRWLKLAEDLMRQGDLRSALRAFYLASLSHLARHNVIAVARFKSNREYEKELYRRAHHAPDLLAAFSGNMKIYEGIWYGRHSVTDETVRIFRDNQTRIMTIANKL